MRKNALSVTVVLALAGLAAYYLYLNYNRFSLVPTQGRVAYEIDRKTGRTWTLSSGGKKIHSEAEPEPVPKETTELPLSERSKLTGNAEFYYDSFRGRLYNGSAWTVTEVVFVVAAVEKRGLLDEVEEFNRAIPTKEEVPDSADGSKPRAAKSTTRWQRHLRWDKAGFGSPIKLEPLSTESFSVAVTGAEGADIKWSIESARGIPPK